MNKVRLHAWIDEDMVKSIIEESNDMNVNKSEMLRIIIARHYRRQKQIKRRYKDNFVINKLDRKTKSINSTIPLSLCNKINKYCNDNRMTRSSFIRMSCIDMLEKERCL